MTIHQWYSVDITEEDGTQDIAYFDDLQNAFDEVESRQESCLANPPNARIVFCDREFVEPDNAHPDTLIGAWHVRDWGAVVLALIAKAVTWGIPAVILYGLFFSPYAPGLWNALDVHHRAYMAEHHPERAAKPSLFRPSGRRAQQLSD